MRKYKKLGKCGIIESSNSHWNVILKVRIIKEEYSLSEANTHEAINFDVQITKEDYFRFNYALYSKSMRILWVIALVYLVFLIVGVAQKGISALGFAPF